jgi:glutaredoxin 3
MRPVTVYTTETCKACEQVKQLLDVRDVPYEEIFMKSGGEEHRQLAERTGMSTLPLVFVGSILVGGRSHTFAADQSGMLADLLRD